MHSDNLIRGSHGMDIGNSLPNLAFKDLVSVSLYGNTFPWSQIVQKEVEFIRGFRFNLSRADKFQFIIP